MSKFKSKKAQEEMVGFVLIIILVAVIGLIFLRIYLQKPQAEVMESYEIESFLQSVLQCSSTCSNLEIKDLIFECSFGGYCGERLACEVLEENLEEILESSWDISNSSKYEGYEMKIISESGQSFDEILNISKGEKTINYKGSVQNFAKSGGKVEISLKVYY